MSLLFTLEIAPKPQVRHRTIHGGRRTYDPSSKYKNQIKEMARMVAPAEPVEGALRVTMSFYLAMPKAFGKRKQDLAIQGQVRPFKRPDLSNYIKAVEDALDGIIWRDDGQIVEYGPRTGKYFSEFPRIEVMVETLNVDLY